LYNKNKFPAFRHHVFQAADPSGRAV